MGDLTQHQPLRLAILEADTPQPQTNARYGGYGGVFTALLTAAAGDAPDALASKLKITAHDVVNEPDTAYPSLDDVDALLITGSRHTAFNNDEWIKKLVAYAKAAVDTGRVRVVGVCFGHQILARAMDAPVTKNTKGWEVAVTDFDLTDKGKEIFQLGEGVEKLVHLTLLFAHLSRHHG
jgi:GMP synthase-like glutamine amidotransferase